MYLAPHSSVAELGVLPQPQVSPKPVPLISQPLPHEG